MPTPDSTTHSFLTFSPNAFFARSQKKNRPRLHLYQDEYAWYATSTTAKPSCNKLVRALLPSAIPGQAGALT
jgi:hypothetical protein